MTRWPYTTVTFRESPLGWHCWYIPISLQLCSVPNDSVIADFNNNSHSLWLQSFPLLVIISDTQQLVTLVIMSSVARGQPLATESPISTTITSCSLNQLPSAPPPPSWELHLFTIYQPWSRPWKYPGEPSRNREKIPAKQLATVFLGLMMGIIASFWLFKLAKETDGRHNTEHWQHDQFATQKRFPLGFFLYLHLTANNCFDEERSVVTTWKFGQTLPK